MITIVRGKQTETFTRSELDARMAAYAGVTVDLGTGDGAWAYRYAHANADRFVVAIDPVRENLREYSARAARKAERGGLSNVLYVVASAEQITADLRAIADEMYITLPWGSLMRGLILADPQVLDGIAAIARPNAAVRIVLNTRIFEDPIPLEARDLPDLTPAYIHDRLASAYARHGIVITEARLMSGDEVATLSTTWAKRLSHRGPPSSMYVEAMIRVLG